MESVGILGVAIGIAGRLWPVWLALALVVLMVFKFKRRLGLFGRLFDDRAGIAGVLICGFWLFTAIFADVVAPLDPRVQVAVMKNAVPGATEPESGMLFLLGGDLLARDVFSRVVYGARIVLTIAPAATLIAFLVGISLGLPAGYFGQRTDQVLSFLANLVLAFPVILLFYLLVTPGIMDTPIPYAMAGVMLLVPIIFFLVLFYTGYEARPERLYLYLGLTLVIGGWIYAGLVFDSDPLGIIAIEPNELNIFIAVVFASSPGVFRIVRGLCLEIKTRDYIAAAQTRGESPWYIMLWEMLPNARGPLIVDACLRIGYTTILLGTLGFFGLGMGPESPDWGTAIKDGSNVAQLRLYFWQGLAPAIALMSLVLGLNLLADSLREQSLRD
ncbi:peptide/nickel transport system permease protein [Dongia mobilis]|uniref:Peptide/nickel transport system permease protein n=1 Tax=Dongia mobilis TaxID=578943 RepID=A0A4V3DDZ0_9PROT|nr:ABC transporter permease [Dongia mobilis]TDQ78975.1 peptide/nickel transport system permease protein [Dongia mobilis]